MINLNKKDSVADSVKSILEKKELSPKQKQIAKMSPPADKIDAGDLAKLRAGQKPVKESAKPDFLDLDKDGNTTEPMKQAAKQAKMKKMKEEVTDTLKGREKKSADPFLSKKVKIEGDVKEEVEQIEEKEKWIQKAIKKPGALHKQLHVPAGEKIPAEKLKSAAEKGGKLGKRANLAMTLKKFKEEYEEHSIFDQMIQEVLSKDASAGDWIHDFVHSDNPKFKGKSTEMRKKMALAAYYAKQRNEEVETDICPDCMQDPCVCGGNHIEEEVEQIDELKKSTLGSYVKKASDDAMVSRKLGSDFANKAKRVRGDSAKGANTRLAAKFNAMAIKRRAGVNKAVDRLTKEEVDQVEENAFDWKKPRPPESKGGSGVKQGRAYGGAAQKSKPEHDEPEAKKKVTESKRPETDNVPFEGPYNPTDKPATVTDKSGAKHTPMSRVKHLAKQAMKRMKTEMLGKTGTSEDKAWK
jgi:hypothetical protein